MQLPTTDTHPNLAKAASQLGLILADVHVTNRPSLRQLHGKLLNVAASQPEAAQKYILSATRFLVEADDIWKQLPPTHGTDPGVVSAVQQVVNLVIDDAATARTSTELDIHEDGNGTMLLAWMDHLTLYTDD